MKRIPRLFIRGQKIVWPTGPHAWRVLDEEPRSILTTVALLHRKDKSLYVVDVDGLENGEANLSLYQKFERAGIHPWLQGGFRRVADVVDGFFAGAERITIRLSDMKPERLRRVGAMTESPIYIGLLVDAGGFEKGWRTDEVAGFARDAAADGIVLEADHDADAHRLGNAAFDLRRHGFEVAVAPWPGTSINLPDDRADFMLYDGGVEK